MNRIKKTFKNILLISDVSASKIYFLESNTKVLEEKNITQFKNAVCVSFAFTYVCKVQIIIN